VFNINVHSQRYNRHKGDLHAVGFDSLRTDPMKSINWHIHRNGCPHYREHWPKGTDLEAGEPLYQVFAVKHTAGLYRRTISVLKREKWLLEISAPITTTTQRRM